MRRPHPSTSHWEPVLWIIHCKIRLYLSPHLRGVPRFHSAPSQRALQPLLFSEEIQLILPNNDITIYFMLMGGGQRGSSCEALF